METEPLSNTLQRLRDAWGVSQDQAASLLGVSREWINRVETGRRQVDVSHSLANLIRLAARMNQEDFRAMTKPYRATPFERAMIPAMNLEDQVRVVGSGDNERYRASRGSFDFSLSPGQLADRIISTRDMNTVDNQELVDDSIKLQEPGVPMLLSGVLVALGAIKTTGRIAEGEPVPVVDSTPDAEWVAEGAEPVGSGDAVTRTVLMEARQLIFPPSHVTRRLIQQSFYSVVNVLESQTVRKADLAVEAGAIAGTGAPQPTGLVGAVPVSAASGALSRANIIDTVKELENAGVTTTGLAVNPNSKALGANTPIETGQARYLFENGDSPTGLVVAGTDIPVGVSAGVPDNKVLVGDWSKLRIIYNDQVDFRVLTAQGSVNGPKGRLAMYAYLDTAIVAENVQAWREINWI